MKRFFNLLILFLGFLILGFHNSPVYAAQKEYDIEKAEFNVYLDKDGNAHITEKWELNFKKGDFTSFYVNRLKDPNELENMKILNLTILKSMVLIVP